MHFRRVCLESFGYTLPDEVVTTAELERRLAPLYERLRLPEGRLELMTGIRERRFFPPGTRPSTSASNRPAGRSTPAASTRDNSALWFTARSAAISWSRPPPAASITVSACRPKR